MIIGLIVGGVLTGQNLIEASKIRSTISQVERYSTAVNTFREKYGALPGDIAASSVSQFGFTVVPTRPGTTGLGDGNGALEGWHAPSNVNDALTNGETAWFWEDLSSNANLIEGAFSYATATGVGSSTTAPGRLVPEAKIGNGNYVYVYSYSGTNYFGLSDVGAIDANGAVYSAGGGSIPGLTVSQAYAIDKKTDDGFPQTGNVTAKYQNWYLSGSYVSGALWAAGGGVAGASSTSATVGSPATCYDNSISSTGTPGVAGAAQHYSLEMSNGANNNCALSFRFQ